MYIPAWPIRILSGLILLVTASDSIAQTNAQRASRNMELVAQTALGGHDALSAVHLDQNADRPYAYAIGPKGLHVVQTEDGQRVAGVRLDIPQWNDLTSFPLNGRTYVAGIGPHALMVWDVTDAANPVETRRSEGQAGGIGLFAYRAADGEGHLFTAGPSGVHRFSLGGLVSGQDAQLIPIALPDGATGGFRDVFAAYHDESESDRLYVAGAGGYYVLDLASSDVLAAVSSAAVQMGTSITATPDGTHVITTANYRTAPVRIFDIRPVLDGTISQIRTAAGAWTANWKNHAERHALRWPFIFVAAQDDGLHVVNMRNPFEPYTEGFFRTWDGTPAKPGERYNGARDVDVRNSDGLIAVADAHGGLFLLRMESFQGWDGRGWGQPDISSVQDWENGPVGSTQW